MIQKKGLGIRTTEGRTDDRIRISIKYILLTPNNLLLFIQTK
jgi:hypothetical protein